MSFQRGEIFLRHQTKPKDPQAPTLVDRHLGAPLKAALRPVGALKTHQKGG